MLAYLALFGVLLMMRLALARLEAEAERVPADAPLAGTAIAPPELGGARG